MADACTIAGATAREYGSDAKRVTSTSLTTAVKEGLSISNMLDPQDDPRGASRAHTTPAATRQGVRPARMAGLLALLLLTLVALPRPSAFADSTQTGAVTSPDGLNLRSGPDTSAGILTVMPTGAQVTITGTAQNGSWLPVTYNGQDGFADGAYITVGSASNSNTSNASASNPAITASGASSSGAATLAASATASATPAPSPSPAASSTNATVLPSDGLNLRSSGGGSTVVTVMPGGSTVTITGAAQSGWEPVTYNGQSGWADGIYLTTNGSDPIITASGAASSGAALLASATPAPSGTPSASSTPAASGSSSPPGSPVGKFIWPSTQRRISTVFSAAHLAIDIDQFANPNERVNASASGTVTFAGGDACCSYGYHVIIDHGNGLETLYAHFSSITVKVGQAVQQGQQIGAVGCTGKCTGNHIHFEIHVHGTNIDPLSVLPPPWTIE